MSVLAYYRRPSLGRTRVGSTTGDTTTDSNGVRWTYETGTSLPWGKIRASSTGYGADAPGAIDAWFGKSEVLTEWYDRDFGGDSADLQAWIAHYAASNTPSTASSSSSSSKTSKPKPTTPASPSGGGGFGTPGHPTPIVQASGSGSGTWLYALAAGLGVAAWWFLRKGL